MHTRNKTIGRLLLLMGLLLGSLTWGGGARGQTAVSDSFTGTAGTLLESHTGETGATWTKATASTTTLQIGPSGEVRLTNGAAYAAYSASGAPATADYDVSAPVHLLSATGAGGTWRAGVIGRYSAGSYYAADIENGAAKIYKFVGASGTALGTGSIAGVAYGSSYTVRLTLRGSALTMYVNGTSVVTATDSSLTAAGAAGVEMFGAGASDTDGIHVGAITATVPVVTTSIYADNAAWVVSPYNHSLTGSGAASVDRSVNPGYYRRIYITGATTAALTFSAATGTGCVIASRWDGGAWTRAAVSASVTLSPPANTTAAHLLEWAFAATPITSDRWTSSPPTNAIQFTGLVLSSGAAVAAPPIRPKNVIVYTDSIGEGTRTLAANSGYPVSDMDATLSAYFALQDTLNAEVGLIGFSGQGVVNGGNSSSENVPALSGSYNLVWSGVSRSFALQPDLLIICEGQNDSGQSAATFLAGLNTVVAGVGAKKTLIMGDENGYFTAQEQSVTGAAYGIPATLSFATDSYDGIHPTAAAHRAKMLKAVSAAALPLLYSTTGTKRRLQ